MRAYLSVMTAMVFGMTAVSGAEASEPTHHGKAHAAAHHSHKQKGRISYYHSRFTGKKMANGEAFRPESNAAASKALPLGTKAKVTNLENGKSDTVEVKDRGPAVPGRVMDVSPATADKLDMKKDGTVPAEITPIEGAGDGR